jgi:hypothetical protein
MERILYCDLDDTGSYVDHELSIDDTDLVKATAVGTDVVESCEKRLYASVGYLLLQISRKHLSTSILRTRC